MNASVTPDSFTGSEPGRARTRARVLQVDHLVLAARTLVEGLDWCEATLGLRPNAGGRHDFMGTHNRVFAIGSAAFPRTYFEIISIDPEAPAPAHARWFDLDDAALQRTLAADGPRLVHWVARCDDIAAIHTTLRNAGIDVGVVQAAERMTPQGRLRWRIGVRADGRRMLGGGAPALIEWGAAHPTDAMPPTGVTLQSMQVAGWPAALAAMLPAGASSGMQPDAPPLRVLLSGLRGSVTLESA